MSYGQELTPADNRRRLQLLRAGVVLGKRNRRDDFDRFGGRLCPECGKEPSVSGGRCFLCRGKSMQP